MESSEEKNADLTKTKFPGNLSGSLLTMKFPLKLWRMVHECRSGAIGWDETGTAVVVDYALFKREYLTKNERISRWQSSPASTAAFKTSNLSSFIRQMNLYGFHKSTCCRPLIAVNEGLNGLRRPEVNDRTDVHVFRHHLFVRGRIDLLRHISRNSAKRIANTGNGRTLHLGTFHRQRPIARPVVGATPPSRIARSRRVHKSTKSKVYRSGQPLTSRKIRKYQKALTKALERATVEWKIQQTVGRLEAMSENDFFPLVMDGDTEQLLNSCIEDVNYNLSEDLNEDFAFQWDSFLSDWQSNETDIDNSFSEEVVEVPIGDHFESTVDAEAIGISRYSSRPKCTGEDKDIAAIGMDTFDLSAEEQQQQQFWNDVDLQLEPMFNDKGHVTASDQVEGGSFDGATFFDMRALSFEDYGPSPQDQKRKKLIELAAHQPDLTRELLVLVDDDYYRNPEAAAQYDCREHQRQQQVNVVPEGHHNENDGMTEESKT